MLLEFQPLRLGRSGNSTARPRTNKYVLTYEVQSLILKIFYFVSFRMSESALAYTQFRGLLDNR